METGAIKEKTGHQTIRIYKDDKPALSGIKRILTKRWGQQATFADVVQELLSWYDIAMGDDEAGE